jgi:cyclopropane fatty-acyl-phospholipid synthase-like methyltransferase
MTSKQAWTNKIESIYHSQMDRQEQLWEQLGLQSTHHSYHEDDDDSMKDGIRKMHRLLADKADVAAGSEVLNIGCGGGGGSVWLADTRDASVVGVDVTQKFVESAREHAESEGVADLCEFRHGDFHELSAIPDDSVDVVWALQSIHHAYDYEAVSKEANRVLREDGTLVVADFFQASGDLSEKEQNRFEFFNEATKSHTVPIGDFESTLEDAGFSKVVSEEHTENVIPFEKRLYRVSLFMYPLLKLVGLVGLGSEAAADDMKSTYYGYRLIKSGARQFNIVEAQL